MKKMKEKKNYLKKNVYIKISPKQKKCNPKKKSLKRKKFT